MKKYRLLTLTLLALCMGPETVAQNIDALPAITGAAVDMAQDKILIRDASVPAANGALRQIPLGELVNVPGLFGNAVKLNHGTAPGNLIRLDPTTGILPAVNGSLLTGLPGSNISAVTGLGLNVATALGKSIKKANEIVCFSYS